MGRPSTGRNDGSGRAAHARSTYYGTQGPAGDIFAVGADSSAVDPKRIGIVGLGAGALAAYLDNWMSMTYLRDRSDRHRGRVSDPAYLHLSWPTRRATPRSCVGDARLSLADEPDAIYDLLIMDAFSSDAIPVHLITVEAITRRAPNPCARRGHRVPHFEPLLRPVASRSQPRWPSWDVTAVERASPARGRAGDPSLLPSRWIAASRSTERIDALRALGWEDVTRCRSPIHRRLRRSAHVPAYRVLTGRAEPAHRLPPQPNGHPVLESGS